jgi:hypothetical protein
MRETVLMWVVVCAVAVPPVVATVVTIISVAGRSTSAPLR